MNPSRVVLCMKWGKLYPAEYVNVLHQACRRHITGDFRFVCLTNETEGIEAGVEVFPIPDIGLDEPALLQRGLAQAVGLPVRAVRSDGPRPVHRPGYRAAGESLDPLFEAQGPLVAIDSGPGGTRQAPPARCPAIFAFDLRFAGVCGDRITGRVAMSSCAHLQHRAGLPARRGARTSAYWPQEWLVSFKYHVRQPLLIDRFRKPQRPADRPGCWCSTANPVPSIWCGHPVATGTAFLTTDRVLSTGCSPTGKTTAGGYETGALSHGHPAALPLLGETLRSLLAQSAPVHAVNLYLPRKYRRFEFDLAQLPAVPAGVNICLVDTDYGPATKALPAVAQYKEPGCCHPVLRRRQGGDRPLLGTTLSGRQPRAPGLAGIVEARGDVADYSSHSFRGERQPCSSRRPKDWAYRLRRALSLGS